MLGHFVNTSRCHNIGGEVLDPTFFPDEIFRGSGDKWKHENWWLKLVWTPSLFKGVGGKFWLPHPEGEIWKIKKRGESIVQRQVFLKGGLALFLFHFFKVYHFYIWKLLYPLQKLCYSILWKKFILGCLIFVQIKKCWLVGLGQERFAWRWGELSKIP